MRAVKLALRVIGWSEEQSYEVTTKNHLLSDPKKFEELVLGQAGFMATPMLAHVLSRHHPAPREDTSSRTAETSPVPPKRVAARPVELALPPKPQSIPEPPSASPVTLTGNAPPAGAEPTENVREALVALSQGLVLDHEGWEDPRRLLAEARQAAEQARQSAPDEAMEVLATVERLETRLPAFPAAYVAQQRETDTARFAPWFRRCLMEVTSAETGLDSLEARLEYIAQNARVLHRNAVRCFLFAPDDEIAAVSAPPERTEAREVPADSIDAPAPSGPVSEPVPVAAARIAPPEEDPRSFTDLAAAAGFGS
jgi:hypothetical protein